MLLDIHRPLRSLSRRVNLALSNNVEVGILERSDSIDVTPISIVKIGDQPATAKMFPVRSILVLHRIPEMS